MKRLTISIALSLLFILASLAILANLDQPPAYAAPSYQFIARPVFWRFLDTDGDGTGTKEATGNYTETTTFYLQPPAGAVYVIDRLVVSVEDSDVITSNLYGSVLITNGISIQQVTASGLITLTDGVTITGNLDWRRFCEVEQTANAGTTNHLQAICTFGGSLLRLNGDQNERIEVLLEDDFSGLDGHYFMVQGFRE
jgi:hypothetical protein